MTVFLSQDFVGATETPQAQVGPGVSITGAAGPQTLTATAGTFDSTAFAVGRACHIVGMTSGDGSYRVTALAGDGSAITVTPEGTTYSRSVPTYVNSTTIIRTGCKSTDLDALLGSMQHSTQDNPGLVRILNHATYGACLEKWTPKLKTFPENNGWQYFGNLTDIGATGTDLWMAYWVLFRPGEAYGTLSSDITASSTSISFTLSSGSIDDFPADSNQPYGSSTPEWTNRECAMYVILSDGEPGTDPTTFETVGYTSRTGSGPYTITLASTAWRGLQGTTAKAWAAGTRITIGYDFNHGHKMPGFEAGSVPGRIGTRGVDFAQIRLGYVAFDWDSSPTILGIPNSYAYNDTVSASFWWWGKTNKPASYTGSVPARYKQNQWQAVEARVVMDTSKGAGNGQIHAWLDGVKVQEKTNVAWRDATASFSQWGWLVWSSHFGDSAGDAAQKYERFLITGFTIANSQIDLYSIGAPPFGLSVSASTNLNNLLSSTSLQLSKALIVS